MCGGFYVKIAIFPLLLLLQAAFTAGAFGKIRVHPMETSFNRGDNLTLNCSVEQGGPADVIFWYKGDKPIRFYRESNLSQWAEVSLIDVTYRDVGQYRCIVRKGTQFDSYVFDLHVNGIPSIKGVRKREVLMQGEDKAIPCKADGWPLPTLKWIRNNSEIIDQNDNNFHLINGTGELVLQIKTASQKHQGCYTCVATNTFGEDRQTVNISVHAKTKARGPEIRVEKHYVIAEEGWNLTLNCQAYYTVWFLSAWKWKLNGKEIVNEHKQHYIQDIIINDDEHMTLVLKITNVSRRDGGSYTCEIVTQQGFDKGNITLIVEDEGNLQNITTKWKMVEIEVGTQVKLECVASYPRFIKATKWWTFRGRHLEQTDSRYGMEGYVVRYSGFFRKHSGFMWAHKMSLWISNITESDFGNYTCVLNTSLGSSLETILLLPKTSNKDNVASGKGNTTVLVLLFPLLAFGLLISITGYLLLRKMWKKQNHTRLREKVNEGEFVYDVFVTYSNRDRHWVTEKLMPLLEKQRLKCCIHSRDFELGRALVDNMAESVYSSRKVLAVLSRNYLDSRFCREELDMALHRSKVGHDCSLMVIRIDGIQKSKLPKALRDKTFLDFQDCKDKSRFEKELMRFLTVDQAETNGKVNNTVL